MHGIEIVSFVEDKDDGWHPYFRCMCGWESNRDNKTWEAAGREFDSHLDFGSAETASYSENT